MAQQNLNNGLLPDQLRLAGHANFVELFALLNSAYGLNLSPINLNVGLSPSQILTAARLHFSQIYAALNQQAVSTSPRYLNQGLSQDQLRAAAQANFTELYTLLGTAQVPPAGFTFILDSDGNRLLGSDGQYLFGVAF